MFEIPQHFVAAMIELHGQEGREWLERLPDILRRCEERWDIRMNAPFPNISFHYVAPGVCGDGGEVVVKAHSPTGEFRHETDALRFFAGRGVVRLLEMDEGDEVFLMERLQPGTPLRRVQDDEESIAIAAATMRQMWRAVPDEHTFPSVHDWEKGFERLRRCFDGGTGPFPVKLIERAERLYAELEGSSAEHVLLHGDLHHDNILATTNERWVAVDPKGLIGEPSYEIGALLRNPLPDLLRLPHPERILARRVDGLAERLGFQRARVRDWGFAQAVLSAWWGFEDAECVGWDALACAELLAEIKW